MSPHPPHHRRRRRTLRAALATGAALTVVLAGDGVASASEPNNGVPNSGPHPWVYSYVTADNVGVYADRLGDPWYCDWFGVACGAPPQRPINELDQPIWTVNRGSSPELWCWRGSYFLVTDSQERRSGWVVAGEAVRTFPPRSDGGRTEPEQCNLTDSP